MLGCVQVIQQRAATARRLWKKLILFKEALKEQSVGLVRADSGFYTEEILEYLECNHLTNNHNKVTLNTLKSYFFALGAWTVNHSIKRH
jgi:hypothetical protein